MMDY
jgi:hypothetical protein